ncbi:hypothetical protein DY000_02039385 [Brassica cretica]|uniref:Uncharacterized protein n=1 Tax=Brassica cretica TaxID=69181 RepID=A0ABQ7BP26_BRACR|nr:hypothetical protein DY000_02039385 [Brassica cretica]
MRCGQSHPSRISTPASPTSCGLPLVHNIHVECLVPGFEDESITSTIPPPPEIEAPSLRSPPPPL